MPYILKPNKLFAKNPDGSGFLPQNVVIDRVTSDAISKKVMSYASTEVTI